VRIDEELLPAEYFFEEVVDFERPWGCQYLLAKRYMYAKGDPKDAGS
jgi:hypothetical protein